MSNYNSAAIEEFNGGIWVFCRADELVHISHVSDGICLAFREIVVDGCDSVEASFFASGAVVFQQSVQAAHQLV